MTTPMASFAVAGELVWNVKQSFRDYVRSLPDGEETRFCGGDDDDLKFPAVSARRGDDPVETVTFTFAGGVRFLGYRGLLRVELREPWLTVEGSRATLTVDTAAEGTPASRVPVAVAGDAPTPNADGSFVWTSSTTTLTPAGAALLGSVYSPDTIADGFAVRIEALPIGGHP